ncbi:transmembrane protein 87A [Panicum miliaceum]|uniref:Transmembrane protein 87A n=1 Tax=Panicum miliaceum TaxID=4540 RepID=A0A3L6TQS8_PANMI|nr:transmembrane protein 87A [Panicum miliaceum]
MPWYTNLNHPPPRALSSTASKASPRTFHPSPTPTLSTPRHESRQQQGQAANQQKPTAPARALPTTMRPPRRAALALALGLSLVALLAARGTVASVHEYAGGGFAPRANSFFFHGGSEGLYASDPSSNSSASFIRFDTVVFRRTLESASRHEEMQQKTGLVEAIIVEIQDRDKIGGSYLHSDAICCTPELDKEKSCRVGEVIIRPNPDNPEWPKRIQTFFEGKKEETTMPPQLVSINKTGMYYLYFMFCDPQLKGLKITGRTVWRNPQGYLPGKMAPMMTFYGFMSLAYLALGLLWFIQFVRCWKDILQLHYHITAVIALGMCEMAFWYFEYANFNSTGTRPMGITIWAVTFTAVKKTVSRLLLLVVSMGYGIVLPTLGGITSRVAALGFIYFIASEALELVENLGNINDFSGKTRLFLVLPVAILDATFIIWIFSSLSRTLEKLQLRRSMAKLELYRKFTNSLAVSVLISIAWIGYELYFNATDPLSELWQRAWIIPSFWNVLSYALLAIICILWSPSRNPTGFAYSEDAGEGADEEGLSLVGSAMKGTGDMVNMHIFPEDKRA